MVGHGLDDGLVEGFAAGVVAMVEQHLGQAQAIRPFRHLSLGVVVDHHLNLGMEIALGNGLGDGL